MSEAAKRYYVGSGANLPRDLLCRIPGTEVEPARGFAPTLGKDGKPRLFKSEKVLWEGDAKKITADPGDIAKPIWELSGVRVLVTDLRLVWWTTKRRDFGKGQLHHMWTARVESRHSLTGIKRLPHTLTATALVDKREADTGHDPNADHRDINIVLPAADAPQLRDLLIEAIIKFRLANVPVTDQQRTRLEKASVALKAQRGGRELKLELPGWTYAPPFLDTEHVKQSADKVGWTIPADATP